MCHNCAESSTQPYDRAHRRAPRGSEHRRRHYWLGAQPCLRGGVRPSDDCPPITSALQTGFNKAAQIGNGSGDTNGEDDWLGQGNGLRTTDAAARQSRFGRRTTRAGTEGRSRHIEHTVARPEHHADEPRHSTLWEWEWHNYDEQSDQQNLSRQFLRSGAGGRISFDGA